MDNFACRCQTAPALSSDRPQAVRLYLSDLQIKVMYEYEIGTASESPNPSFRAYPFMETGGTASLAHLIFVTKSTSNYICPHKLGFITVTTHALSYKLVSRYISLCSGFYKGSRS